TSTVTPLGRISFTHYADAGSQKPDYQLVKDSGGANLITSFTYDSYGRVTEKVMPKGDAGRSIDSQGNLQGTPDTTYATDTIYYASGETAAPPTACGGGTAVDQAQQIKSVATHGLATQSFVYDSGGRPIASTSGVGTICRTYNAEG